MAHDIVITGFGALGSFGGSHERLWQALLDGRPLLSKCSRLADQSLAAEITDFNLDDFKRTAKGHRAPRISQYALAAAAQAIHQAKLGAKAVDKDAVSIVYGTGNGPNDVVERNLAAITHSGLGAVEPLSFQESVFNAPASLISIEYSLRGPLLALPMGWAAGGYAVAIAADLILFGHASVVIVVVSDELSDIGHSAMKALKLISPKDDPNDAIRPFDIARSGAICGEGGAAIILETREHATARGAVPLLELAGWGITSDSFGVGPKANGVALASAMLEAVNRAGGLRPDVIYAGSYCTADADLAEAAAIASTFGGENRPLVTNIRGAIGEAKAPTGIFNILAAEASLRTGTVPATTGCRQVDPQCNIEVCIRPTKLASMEAVMCNAFWVNGTNTSLLLRVAR
ncbi:beta-ketoacyl synthase N-terminal-like domain-containing protein [Sulfuritalea sp.]|uniref:beta-ketoacyl synthase N-terminal-like domain-containing protein n=1 Tax=Sulfuritalea sp. TaxID=2480090 RepID=UPI00286E093D|nr:beta-ketoacyl synthase N-terminal-like domain-containing protein [Sulfuritalea sp.]